MAVNERYAREWRGLWSEFWQMPLRCFEDGRSYRARSVFGAFLAIYGYHRRFTISGREMNREWPWMTGICVNDLGIRPAFP